MANWLRLSITCSMAVMPSIVHAELLNFQCSFYNEVPIGVTVDDQARTVSTKEGYSYDLGGGAFKVLKITKEAIWFIAHEKDADDASLKITVLERSNSGNRRKGGSLSTAVVGGGQEPFSSAPPGGVCWELPQKQP
ncbi:hypothetical protein [Microvirga ossetica]|uniref:hypothetical protein n=1 Tax=Microvirga ossetica TaxID=1882682 RepID=UPI0012FFFDD5|nr:hypothetical protein [Microvirga ossetica]